MTKRKSLCASTKHEPKHQNRSDKYQFVFAECPVEIDFLQSFTNADSIKSALTGGFVYDERILDLKDKLVEAFWILAKEVLTDQQHIVLSKIAEGRTQHEISEELKINQSSVNQSIFGALIYSSKTKQKDKKRYGGAMKTLETAIKSSVDINNILAEISELQQEENW